MISRNGWEWRAEAEDAAKMEDAGINYLHDFDRFAFLLLEVWSGNGVGYLFFTEWEL